MIPAGESIDTGHVAVAVLYFDLIAVGVLGIDFELCAIGNIRRTIGKRFTTGDILCTPIIAYSPLWKFFFSPHRIDGLRNTAISGRNCQENRSVCRIVRFSRISVIRPAEELVTLTGRLLIGDGERVRGISGRPVGNRRRGNICIAAVDVVDQLKRVVLLDLTHADKVVHITALKVPFFLAPIKLLLTRILPIGILDCTPLICPIAIVRCIAQGNLSSASIQHK